MERIKVYAHGCYVGNTGYNNHTRDFFRQLSNHLDIKVRNFTVGNSWSGYSIEPHNGEKNIDEDDKKILYQQTIWEGDKRVDREIYPSRDKEFSHDLNLVLSETNHHYFYDHYLGPKIAYNVWESTLQPSDFFQRLKDYDEVWVPSKWQKECMISQGYEESKVQVVPEGVDSGVFFPEKVNPPEMFKDGRFKFLLFGRWDYRKSTKEIIQTFLKTFDPSEPVDLIVSIDNPFGARVDGMNSTDERLKFHGISDPRIKILNFPSREEYIKILKTGHVFVSCARSEGWNLPLIEAMACGTPSIYSLCSGQMEFAEGRGIPVKILGERSTRGGIDEKYSVVETTSSIPGNYYEPDFQDLSRAMREAYNNYDSYKVKAVEESKSLREEFSWERIGEIGYEKIKEFYKKVKSPEYLEGKRNTFLVSYFDGPRVEISGDVHREYLVQFLDEKKTVVHESKITPGMWTSCSKRYFVPWEIKVDGETIDVLNLEGKRVLISLESRSLGDNIAWAPYAVEFSKKHKCKVILSTFYNSFFEGIKEYEGIEFLPPGGSTQCYAIYRIGWFRDENGGWKDLNRNPKMVNTIPLQQCASDALGLEYKELNFGLNLPKGQRPIPEKYVVFAPQSTAGCKEWSYESWVSLAGLLEKIGYKTVIITKTPYYIKNCINLWDESFEKIANYLYHAESFVGLTSGLSWMNWALGKYTHVIDGLSRPWFLFQSNSIKIYNDNVCIFCGNDEVFAFDAGDWDWCPVYRGTSKQHICQKSITPIQVFNSLSL